MNSRPAIRVMTVDDHPLMREGIAALIGSQPAEVELMIPNAIGFERSHGA